MITPGAAGSGIRWRRQLNSQGCELGTSSRKGPPMTRVTGPVPTGERSSLWRSAEVRRLAALSVLGFTSFCLTLASVPLWAVSGGAGTSSAGLVTATMLAVTVLVQLAVPWLDRRLGTP